MPSLSAGLIDLKEIKKSNVDRLFFYTKQIKAKKINSKLFGNVVLAFLESSTRTRLSFEMAANNIGLSPVLFDVSQPTSLEKGETIQDSLLNIAAMKPKALVVRCGQNLDLKQLSKKTNIPIACAGWGKVSHPTQALLDLYTISENFDSLATKKILFVGDIVHSRVFASHVEVMKAMQISIGIISTEPFSNADIKKFDSLEEALPWCDVCIALRSQFERFSEGYSLDQQKFRQKFRIDADKLNLMDKYSILMHPGPVNWDWELDQSVLSDPRCRIFNQVENGVYLREALLRTLCGELEL
jgi:aspartate carbamoyltransferase catalytic subunit